MKLLNDADYSVCMLGIVDFLCEYYIHTYIHTLIYTGQEIYYLGIVDFLCEYSAKRRSAALVKRLLLRDSATYAVSYVCVYVCM